MNADADPFVGRIVAERYEVTRRLGKGGMGSVYEVSHVELRRRFAMKTIAAELVDNAQVIARFRREADAVARLRHPHIVDIMDWVTLEDGSPCIVMEYLEGEDLASRLAGTNGLSWAAVGRVADQVLSALSVAHRAGVVHRDLKPQNIFLARDDAGEERAKLLDFGISKIHDSQSMLTGDQQLLGTPPYMSPEQAGARTREIGPATDVWAMGVILFRMASGRLPFDAPNVPAILYRICHGEPDSVLQFRPDTPPALVEVLGRALSRDLRTRIAEAEQLRRELRAALAPIAPGAFVEPLRADTPRAAAPVPTIRLPEPGANANTTLSSAAGQTDLGADASLIKARPRRLWLLGGAASVAIAAATFLVLRGGPDRSQPDTSAASAKPSLGSAPSAPHVPHPERRAKQEEPTTEEKHAAPSQPSGSVTAPPAPQMVKITIKSRPSGASVYRGADGVLLGETPHTVEFAKGAGMAVFRLERSGFRSEVVRVPVSKDAARTVKLRRIKRRKSTKKTSPARSKKSAPTRKKGHRGRGEPFSPDDF